MRAAAVYTLARLGLLLACAALLHLLGARGLLLVVLAVLTSGLASFLLLTGLRDAMSAALVERRRLARALEAGTAAEDAEDEARRAGGGRSA